MTQEPTAAQWKMRALTAEALLAERDEVIVEQDERIEELLAELSNKPEEKRGNRMMDANELAREQMQRLRGMDIKYYDRFMDPAGGPMRDDRLDAAMMAALARKKEAIARLDVKMLSPPSGKSKKAGPKLGKYDAQMPVNPKIVADPKPQEDVKLIAEYDYENRHIVIGLHYIGREHGDHKWHNTMDKYQLDKARADGQELDMVKHFTYPLVESLCRHIKAPPPEDFTVDLTAKGFITHMKRISL